MRRKDTQIMKNIVLLLPHMHPWRNHNGNLLLRAMPHVGDCNLNIITQSYVGGDVPSHLDNIPVDFVRNRKWFDRILFHTYKLIVGRQRADDLLCVTKIRLFWLFHVFFGKLM